MEINNKAKQYAETISATLIQDAIENAYKAGYQAGYEDGQKDREKTTLPPAGMPEFVDLGLNSDILWASDFLRDDEGNILYLSYEEASQYHLPTKDEWEKLWEYSDRKDGIHYGYSSNSLEKVSLLGPTGKSIELKPHGVKRLGESQDYYNIIIPLASENAEGSALCAVISLPDKKYRSEKSLRYYYKGYTFPVLIVKDKDEQ